MNTRYSQQQNLRTQNILSRRKLKKRNNEKDHEDTHDRINVEETYVNEEQKE